MSTARVDDAVRRILTKKTELGLFERPLTDRTHLAEVGSAPHRALARRAVAESHGRACPATSSPATPSLRGSARSPPDAEVTFSEDASAPTAGHDVGVVVVGETPYAEGFGDVGGPCGRTTACPGSPRRCG